MPFPASFLNHIQQILPEHLNLDEFIDYCQKPLRRSIRVNTLKISVAEFVDRMTTKGWKLEPVPWCESGFWLERPESETVPLGNCAEHLAGLFYIQEASSMLPVTALFAAEKIDQAHTFLDAAAAPGSKTTQMAAQLGNRGLIVANEFSASRIKGLASNIQRCGVTNVATTHFDARVFGQWLPESFDAILLDAPCSGEGTVRKDPDALDNWQLAAIEAMGEIQKELLESAFHALKPGGVLVYSTCTLSHQENQDVCAFMQERFGHAFHFESLGDLFVGAEKALTPEGYLHVWPQIYDSEGFFIARLRKTASVVNPYFAPKRLGKFPFEPMSSNDAAQVQQELTRRFGITLSGALYQRDSEIWLFPAELENLIGKVRFERMGCKIAEIFKKGYRFTHEWALAFGDRASANFIEVDAATAREFMMGRDLYLDQPSAEGEQLIRYRGSTLGLGKWVGSRVKNGLPRELVRDGNLFDE